MGCSGCGKSRRSARKAGVSKGASARAEELRKRAQSAAAPKPPARRPPPQAQRSAARAVPYTIVRGDTMADIGRRFGMTTQEIAKYDGGTGVPNIARIRSRNIHMLSPGEVILVPRRGD